LAGVFTIYTKGVHVNPLAIIARALIAGAAAAQEVVPQAIQDAYQGLKLLIIKKFGAAGGAEGGAGLHARRGLG
jgi:hypothetical protein